MAKTKKAAKGAKTTKQNKNNSKTKTSSKKRNRRRRQKSVKGKNMSVLEKMNALKVAPRNARTRVYQEFLDSLKKTDESFVDRNKTPAPKKSKVTSTITTSTPRVLVETTSNILLDPLVDAILNGSHSDCEIIEDENSPVIVVDDECDHETSVVNCEASMPSCDEGVLNFASHGELQELEEGELAEDDQLFFIDKNPNSDASAPLYEISTTSIYLSDKSLKASSKPSVTYDHLVQGDSSKSENNCSSTRSSCDTANASQMETDDLITSKETADKSKDPPKKETRISNRSAKDAVPAPKRKGKNAHNRSANAMEVIALDDTVEDDSVIFVSETIDKEAKDYIPLPRKTRKKLHDAMRLPRSTRARRRAEKVRGKAVTKRQIQYVSGNNNNNEKNKAPRADGPGSLATASTSSAVVAAVTATSTSPSTARISRRQALLDIQQEEKIFLEKPELFEKRMVVIDGSNVAYAHGIARQTYSIKGIEICLSYFESRGFEVKAVVPQMRLKRMNSSDPDKLDEMYKAGRVVLTPCKNLGPGQRSMSYDDRFILEIAEQFDAAIVSNDNYRDLLNENPKWTEIIKERVVTYSWCNDLLMFPRDPYGALGRTFQLILHKKKAEAPEPSADTTNASTEVSSSTIEE